MDRHKRADVRMSVIVGVGVVLAIAAAMMLKKRMPKGRWLAGALIVGAFSLGAYYDRRRLDVAAEEAAAARAQELEPLFLSKAAAIGFDAAAVEAFNPMWRNVLVQILNQYGPDDEINAEEIVNQAIDMFG